jgi:galactose-1-phosphate uridylyltransferase
VKQLMFFKQYGPLSGGSLVHPHMQVITLPLVTPEYQNRIRRSTDFQKSFNCCPVCHAFRDEPTGSGPASTRLVHATRHFIVSVPFACASPYSLIVVPRVHHQSWLSISKDALDDLAEVLQLVMGVAYDLLNDPSYNLNFISADTDDMIGQPSMLSHPSSRASLGSPLCSQRPSLDSLSATLGSAHAPDELDVSPNFHWHLEVDFRFPADLGGVEIASGIRVICGLPEDFAKELRSAVKARRHIP